MTEMLVVAAVVLLLVVLVLVWRDASRCRESADVLLPLFILTA